MFRQRKVGTNEKNSLNEAMSLLQYAAETVRDVVMGGWEDGDESITPDNIRGLERVIGILSPLMEMGPTFSQLRKHHSYIDLHDFMYGIAPFVDVWPYP